MAVSLNLNDLIADKKTVECGGSVGEPKKKENSFSLGFGKDDTKTNPNIQLRPSQTNKFKKPKLEDDSSELESLDLDTTGTFTKEIKRKKPTIERSIKPVREIDDEIEDSNISLQKKGDRTIPPPVPKVKKEKNPEVEALATKGLDLDKTGEFSTTAMATFNKEQIEKKKNKKKSLKIVEEFKQFKNALDKEPFFNAGKNQYPRIMGDYFVYDHMADGGMAKICRGKYLGEHAIDAKDNLIVIKMIKEEFSKKNDYIAMFLDEIDVAFGFRHPNISAMYDYGKSKENLFVSMEYIHGKDLMDLITDLKKIKRALPLPVALHVAMKMCEGLHYVHNYSDPETGEKLHIVHRDISPHNVMISFKGEVKVIDFGIAKSDSAKQKEEAGTVKGKINYFAPEYLDGKEIDHRYDQFAVALTLWEMLTGRRCFDEGDQILTLKAILNCNPKKPSDLNKSIDSKLDQIIMKALSKNPDDRYQNMQVFAEVLSAYIQEKFPKFVAERDLGHIMKAIYKNRFQRDIGLFKSWSAIAIDGVKKKLKQVKDFIARINAFKEDEEETHRKEMVFDFGFEEEVFSVLDKGKMEQGLQLDFSTKSQRRKDREKAARRNQMAIAALMKGEKSEGSSSSIRMSKFNKEKIPNKEDELTLGKVIGIVLILGCFYYGYKSFTKPSISDLTNLELETLDRGEEFNVHRAFRSGTEYRFLSSIGYIDYEKIVGRTKTSDIEFLWYKYEKFMVNNINKNYKTKVYLSPEEAEQRKLAKEASDEEISELEKNRDFINKLIEQKKKKRRPSNEEE